MGYQEIAARNQTMNIKKVTDSAFNSYGLVHEYDIREVIKYMEENECADQIENQYIPSKETLENLPVVQKISMDIYGGLRTQAGPCMGDNKVLNGIEYHQGSEVTIAVTDCILILGKREDMIGNTYNSAKAEAFYIAKGQTVELFDTTLHYTPCAVKDFFVTMVILLKGTNEPLENINGCNGILMKTNKWFIAHSSNQAKIEAGSYPGLLGDLIKIL